MDSNDETTWGCKSEPLDSLTKCLNSYTMKFCFINSEYSHPEFENSQRETTEPSGVQFEKPISSSGLIGR